MDSIYQHQEIEKKWTQTVQNHQVSIKGASKPYYNLMMFPYPSAEGLHMGNIFSYVGADIHGRFKRAQGFDVFQPIGFDAFGIHSENHAFKVKDHPKRVIQRNVENFRGQLKKVGVMYAWDHEVNTTSPDYYRWTQWLFIQLFNKGLAYKAKRAVSYCTSCQTVLADAMIEAGKCERCGTEVIKKELEQWFLKVSQYADSLAQRLETLDWSEKTIKCQRQRLSEVHDWCVSRQRYWGTPIPIVHCDQCGAVPIDESALPVRLPDIENYFPDGSGKNPLSRVQGFVEITCPKCGGKASRETDVLDNFLDSAWYFLRYPCHTDSEKAFDDEIIQHWLPVDMYVGGNEHAYLHLIYARFICAALHDIGHIPFSEPFKSFRANGVITKDGKKMGKSKGNAVNPEPLLETYGSDALRTFLMFIGPFLKGGEFTDKGIIGIKRFFERIVRYYANIDSKENIPDQPLPREMHVYIQRVTTLVESFQYNRAIATLMECFNWMESNKIIESKSISIFIQMLAPFAPFLGQEIWSHLGYEGTVFDAPWPTYDDSLVTQEQIVMLIQINGKVRERMCIQRGMSQEEVYAMVNTHSKMVSYSEDILNGHIVFVPDRLINFVSRRTQKTKSKKH